MGIAMLWMRMYTIDDSLNSCHCSTRLGAAPPVVVTVVIRVLGVGCD